MRQGGKLAGQQRETLFADFQGQAAGEQSSVGAGPFDFEGGADEVGAIIHDPQSHAGGLPAHVGERQAVVLHGERQFVTSVGEADTDAFGLTMFDRVGHSFLRDFVDLGNDARFQRRHSME